ncbi:MAG: hypothetical protein R2792_20260 [Saprospiraceae bacterium]
MINTNTPTVQNTTVLDRLFSYIPTYLTIKTLAVGLAALTFVSCQDSSSTSDAANSTESVETATTSVLTSSENFKSEIASARQELEQYYATVSEAATQQADSASNRNVNHINSMIMKTVVMSDEIQDLEEAIQEKIAAGGNAAELKQLTDALEYKVSTNKERISEYTRLAKGLVEKEN